jgi:hypothetical protein
MYINKAPILGCALLLGLPAMNLQAAEVNITPDIESVTVKHGASRIRLTRHLPKPRANARRSASSRQRSRRASKPSPSWKCWTT